MKHAWLLAAAVLGFGLGHEAFCRMRVVERVVYRPVSTAPIRVTYYIPARPVLPGVARWERGGEVALARPGTDEARSQARLFGLGDSAYSALVHHVRRAR